MQKISSQIKDTALQARNLTLSIQTATGTPPAAAAYVSFTTAFGTPPFMFAEFIGPFGGAGTMTVSRLQRLDVARVRTGSFQWSGSPTGRARWRAVGLLDLSSA